ncbi:DUF2268 domain-containing putative Zn-dependent protease [Bacillus sp. FJAT-49736]|uniref:DUF2268 domain-containing protein n=1 Tax=Bacillus sp. FJAT-49736 TaxID=2833582 RepID=UPI0024B51BD8|nr:DUF2268 domain-containing putative Zn-dependent protease [Bacillus sp. FJAT-49736]
MYQPSFVNKNIFEELKKALYWQKVEKLYQKYKKLWNGPEVNIYIFPINGANRSLMRETHGKSGLTFEKNLYLFLSPLQDQKELEALFIHEYHHATRMHNLSKQPLDYTLLDSLILEGLAEHAVEEYCGEKYLAEWTRGYSDKQLKRFWHSDFKERLSIDRRNWMHDDLLFGRKFVPRMMGYAIGYKIISEYKKHHPFTIQKTLSESSKSLLIDNFLE